MAHILMLTYLEMEKLAETMTYRLAGYNIFEQEFQELMIKDFSENKKKRSMTYKNTFMPYE